MKRKKWTEAEEETLITAYSELISSCDLISQLRTREKKFQPIADRVNSLHHLLDTTAFPFSWTWKDISIKIQNMRHQYINVKLKLPHSSTANSPDWDHALNLWPNFLHYKTVFGDISPHPSQSSSSSSSSSAASENDKVVNLEDEMRRQRQRRREEEEERRRSWRRREERRGEEEMEWREKMVRMQMEHQKQVMQMHEETCQAQMQMIGILFRLVCQFFGPAAAASAGGGGGGGDGGINGLQVQNQQQEESAGGSLVGDNVKNDVLHSGEDYL